MESEHESWTATKQLDSFDSSLAHLREIVFGVMEAAGARSVAEIGAEHGLFTSELLGWAAGRGGRVTAIDPAPRELLLDLAESNPELELIVGTSHDVLPKLELPDAVVIDGDHNYWTVSEELRLIAERAPAERLPLLLLHDIGWPLARRDSYYVPERIPAEHRQPLAQDAFLVPGEPEVRDRGLYYQCTAATEGGPRNGVLTAVEDFVATDEALHLAVVAPFFGLGVVWHTGAAWADEVERTLAPWDRNPILERVEAKRVGHLVEEFLNLQRIDALRSADYELRFDVIGKLLPIRDSSAFALAERISRLRQAGRANFSRDELGQVIEQLAGDEIRLDQMNGASASDVASESA